MKILAFFTALLLGVIPLLATDSYVPGAQGTAGAAVTQTLAAKGAGNYNVVKGVAWSLSDVPAAAVTLTWSDGSTIIDKWYITAAGPSGVIPFPAPIRGSANTAMTLTMSAPGGSIIATVAFYGAHTE